MMKKALLKTAALVVAIYLISPGGSAALVFRGNDLYTEGNIGYAFRGADMTINDPNAEPFENATIPLSGNLIVEGNGVMHLINSHVIINNAQPYMYEVIVRDSAKLIMDGSSINSSMDMKVIVQDNAQLIMNDGSAINTGGILELGGNLVELHDSALGGDLGVPQVNLTADKIYIYDSSIKSSETVYVHINPTNNMDGVETNDNFCLIGSTVDASSLLFNSSQLGGKNQPLEIVDSTVPGIEVANDETTVYIYRWLNINMRDGAGIPVGNAAVSVEYLYPDVQGLPPLEGPSATVLDYLGKTLSTYYVTDNMGVAQLALISDVINYGDIFPIFVGSYKVRVQYTDLFDNQVYNSTMNVNMPGFDSSTHDEAKEKSVSIVFGNVLISPDTTFYNQKVGTNFDLSESTTITTDRVSDGNIIISGNAVVTVKNSVLTLSQENESRFYILVKDSAVLRLEHSTITSNYPVNIYLYNSAKLEFVNCRDETAISVNTIGLRGNSSISIENSNISANINAGGSSFYAYGSTLNTSANTGENQDSVVYVNQPYFIIDSRVVTISHSTVSSLPGYISFDLNGGHYDTISIDNSDIYGTDDGDSAVVISFSKLIAENSTFDALAVNDGTDAQITNVRTHSGSELRVNIRDSSSVVKKYWWFKVNVRDSNGVPVGGLEMPEEAVVKVTPQGEQGTVTQVPLNYMGEAYLKVLANVTTKASNNFYGTYLVEAVYTGDGDPISASTIKTVSSNITMNLTLPKGSSIFIDHISIPRKISVGEPTFINVYLRNVGNMSATHVDVHFQANDETLEPYTIDKVPATDPTKQFLAQGMWIPGSEGLYNITITVKPDSLALSEVIQTLVYGENDIVVSNEVKTYGGSEAVQVLTSNILVKGTQPGGTFKINGKLKVSQDYDGQYRITVVENSALDIDEGELTSDKALTIYMDDSSELTISGSTVDLNGGWIDADTETSNVNVTIENSVVYANMNIRGSTLVIKNSVIVSNQLITWGMDKILIENSMIVAGDFFITTATFSATDTMFNHSISFTGITKAELTNVSGFSLDGDKVEVKDGAITNIQKRNFNFDVSGSAVVEIFWWLKVKVYDALSFPVVGAQITVKDGTNTAIEADGSNRVMLLGSSGLTEKSTGLTDENGMVVFRVKANTTDAVYGNKFVGNYRVYMTVMNEMSGNQLANNTEANMMSDVELVFNLTEVVRKPTAYLIEVTPTGGQYEPGSTVELDITIMRVYNGVVHGTAEKANVTVTIFELGLTQKKYTNEKGHISYNLTMPDKVGTYQIVISAAEDNNDVVNTTTLLFNVTKEGSGSGSGSSSGSSGWLTVVIVLVVLLVIAAVAGIFVIRMRRMRSTSSYWDDEDEDEDVEEDDEDDFGF